MHWVRSERIPTTTANGYDKLANELYFFFHFFYYLALSFSISLRPMTSRMFFLHANSSYWVIGLKKKSDHQIYNIARTNKSKQANIIFTQHTVNECHFCVDNCPWPLATLGRRFSLAWKQPDWLVWHEAELYLATKSKTTMTQCTEEMWEFFLNV